MQADPNQLPQYDQHHIFCCVFVDGGFVLQQGALESDRRILAEVVDPVSRFYRAFCSRRGSVREKTCPSFMWPRLMAFREHQIVEQFSLFSKIPLSLHPCSYSRFSG